MASAKGHLLAEIATNMAPFPQVEQVRVNQDEEILADSMNPNGEEFICWKYWFPATGNPDIISGIHIFIKVILKRLYL